MSPNTGTPAVVSSRWGVRQLEQVKFGEQLLQERYVQELLDLHPELLPLEAIGARWGPLVSLGREVHSGAGPIGNLFVSPTGNLTLVETRLWRNPKTRRDAVGQVLSNAAALATLSYEGLEDAVCEADGADLTLWERVHSGHPGVSASDEARFVDQVTRGLRAGAFLVLIAGDGIRETFDEIAGMFANYAHLQFHLELIELRFFRLGGQESADDLLVVPTVVGRTAEVTRTVVEVSNPDGQVRLVIDATADRADLPPI